MVACVLCMEKKKKKNCFVGFALRYVFFFFFCSHRHNINKGNTENGCIARLLVNVNTRRPLSIHSLPRVALLLPETVAAAAAA
jgi:hypothetical protein